MKRDILTYPNAALAANCREIDPAGQEAADVAQDLSDTLAAH